MSASRSAADRRAEGSTSFEDAARTFTLTADPASVVIIPAEGAVASDLTISGIHVLARTPWADAPAPRDGAAEDETEWVRSWRGGWQLCFPTAGQPDLDSVPRQGFHGAASQTAWSVTEAGDDRVTLTWEDEHRLTARRQWVLRPDGLDVTTTARNDGASARSLIVAEHLILGGEVLAPALQGSSLRLVVPAGAELASLDYEGAPTGARLPWPGNPDARWDVIDADTPARVAAVMSPPSREIVLAGPTWTATVSWSGLPHALVWEELGRSSDDPWNRSIIAVGIEPTSTPHGAGTRGGGHLTLDCGESLSWAASLRVRPTAPPLQAEEPNSGRKVP